MPSPAAGEKAATEPPSSEKKADAAKKLPGEKVPKQITCGYIAELTVKDGLPVGAFRQLLRFTTNVKTVPSLTIPIAGSVVSEDFVVMGADYKDGVLNIGVVSRGQENRRDLQILASGPHYKAVDFQIVEVNPKDSLVVELGKPVEALAKTGTVTPLVVRIPKGSRQVDCLGTEQSPMGRILLKTNHPSPGAGTLLIRVKFAVTD